MARTINVQLYQLSFHFRLNFTKEYLTNHLRFVCLYFFTYLISLRHSVNGDFCGHSNHICQLNSWTPAKSESCGGGGGGGGGGLA